MVSVYKNALIPSAAHLFKGSNSDWILQEDNDPKHKSLLARTWKLQNNINVLPWPACSPDLNPIENLWKLLKFKVAEHRASNIHQLKKAIKKEWQLLPSDMGKRLVASMERRISAIIEAQGDSIFY